MDTTAKLAPISTAIPRRVGIAYAAVLGLVALVVAAAQPGLVRFHPLSPSQLAEILFPLIAISLFIERAVEVFVAAWRHGHREQLEIEHELADCADRRYDVRHEISEHRSDTRFLALFSCVCAGLAISTLGVRSLNQLVDADMLAAVAQWQRLAFNLLDVLITGALIAGGADGLHKIVAAFTNFMEASSRRARSAG